jgi:hypothetical protein
MSLERVQQLRNFTSQVVVTAALDGTPKTPLEFAAGAVLVALGTLQRVGRLRIILAAGAAVTITDALGTAYTVTNAAAAPTLVHEVPVINGHKTVRLSGTGTVPVVVLAD